MNEVRWSPDGSRLVAELQGQEVTSGSLVVFGADGTRMNDLAGNAAAWTGEGTLVVLRYDTNRFDGPIRLVDLADPRAEPRQIADRAGWILSGPQGLVAIDGGFDPAGRGSFRLLQGRTVGPLVEGRGYPFAFSADGGRLVLEHAWVAASGGVSLAATGSPELGWLEVVTVSDLELVAAFPDEPIERRLPVSLNLAGSFAAASSGSGEATVLFNVDEGTTVEVPGSCCPAGWLPSGELVAASFADGPVAAIDPATGETRLLGNGARASVSPDGLVAIAAGPDERMLVLLRGERVVARAGLPDPVSRMAWRPDGRALAVIVRGAEPPARLVLLSVPELP